MVKSGLKFARHTPITTITQYASEDRIEAIAYQGADPGDDPRWDSTGAADRAEYARWCRHMSCIACLRMILVHRDGLSVPPLFELLAGAREYGVYVEKPDGWIGGPNLERFATYAREVHGLWLRNHPSLEIERLIGLVSAGYLVIASVHEEIRRPDAFGHRMRTRPHLVLVDEFGDLQPTLMFCNPSGHIVSARYAEMGKHTFSRFYMGRAMSVHLSPRMP